LNRYRR